jgi:hypothetical protein
MKKKIKKLDVILFFLLCFVSISFLFLTNCNATSGACSYHDGVNCAAGRQLSGEVICNDGSMDSMVVYDFMVMCQNYQFSCNQLEWDNLSHKYGLEELFFKMQEAIDTIPFNQTYYNLLKNQYDQSYVFAERECFAIGADRASQRNFERMQIEFHGDQIQSAQEEINRLEGEKQKIEEWYQAELEKLEQYSCPLNSTLIGERCYCNTGYAIYNNQCISVSDYCILIYGNHSVVKMIDGVTHCDCASGYIWNSNRTSCIAGQTTTTIMITTTTTIPTVAITNPIVVLTTTTTIITPTTSITTGISFQEFEQEGLETETEKKEKTEEQLNQGFVIRVFNSVRDFFLRLFRRF